ncbi:glyoxalase [Rhizobium sp. NZLR1]|nr:glyoxalase [Rhizobium sp. NZLR1]QSZ25213.1 VOC family protein [Rhizobium sp. NZLR1]
MQLRLELFVEAPETSVDFYRRVLGFDVQGSASTGYTLLTNGEAVIAINSRSALSNDHPLRLETGEKAGLGIEIVLSVADIEEAYRTAKESGWPPNHFFQCGRLRFRIFVVPLSGSIRMSISISTGLAFCRNFSARASAACLIAKNGDGNPHRACTSCLRPSAVLRTIGPIWSGFI